MCHFARYPRQDRCKRFIRFYSTLKRRFERHAKLAAQRIRSRMFLARRMARKQILNELRDRRRLIRRSIVFLCVPYSTIVAGLSLADEFRALEAQQIARRSKRSGLPYPHSKERLCAAVKK